jgi:RHS repeat-associated protein
MRDERDPKDDGEKAAGRTDAQTFAVPAIPKGGGAIRGITEKLTPNVASGTMRFSIPIFTSPCRGAQPTLELSYDSGAGNGTFGLGWTLSVPSISRRTDRGLPVYQDEEESDAFLLTGEEELVPVSRRSDADRVIVRYQPRVEGSHWRIERVHDVKTLDSYWIVVTHDNVTMVFGQSKDARVADPENPAHIFRWLLERVEDDRGNIATYTYRPEDDARLPVAQWERGRMVANAHLKSISYGNRTPGEVGGEMFLVVFDYGEHGEERVEDENDPSKWATTTEKRQWAFRLDAFSSCRSTFEIRTRRLCRRVLMFHRFAELGEDWVLVRSTDFSHEVSEAFARIRSVSQTGYRAPAKDSLPPILFDYSNAIPSSEVRVPDADTLECLPAGLDARHSWVDLDGEGLPGALIASGGGLFYKRNFGGELGPPERLPSQPTGAGNGSVQLVDIDGSGRKSIARYSAPLPGAFMRTDDGGWTGFRSFPSIPKVDFADPNLRMLDIDGDGLADLMLLCDDAVVYFPSLGLDGYGAPHRRVRPAREDDGASIVYSNDNEAIFTADMSGDGLEDLVRIRNGEVCYWPNLGYGRFGSKQTMGNAPSFDPPDTFDPKRLRLADVDGSGTTDIVYLGRDGTHWYVNQAGNTWSNGHAFAATFPSTRVDSASVIDFLGTGTACLVWSSPVPAEQPLRYLELTSGVKPHLLVRVDNSLGRSTEITYAPSTRHYIFDKRAGRPWITRLPIVVHLLERVEVRDRVARSRMVTTYAYHHGHYDGRERELGGFACVEQTDAEAFGVSDDDLSADVWLAPVVTKTWFHTGAYPTGGALEKALTGEFWNGDANAQELERFDLPTGLDFDEEAEAERALRGRMLRQEVFVADGKGDVPVLVRTATYEQRWLVRRGSQRHAIWTTLPFATEERIYERDVADPRVTRTLSLKVDDFGVPTEEVILSFARRVAPVTPDQGVTHAIYTKRTVAHLDDPMAHRIAVPIETARFDVIGLLDPARKNVRDHIDNAAVFELDETASGQSLRRIGDEYTLYYADDASENPPLPKGTPGTRALPHTTFRLAFTKGLIASEYVPLAGDPSPVLAAAGYEVDGQGHWWARSKRGVPALDTFCMPTAEIDPLGNRKTIVWDVPYRLLPANVVDALSNEVSAQYDRVTLSPETVTDANGNVTMARWDALGRIVRRASVGKGEGDTLDAPSIEYDYDLSKAPAVVHTRARMEHGGDRFEEHWTYSDGSGREAMTKVLVPDGLVGQTPTSPRFVGTGRTVFDNKGDPVKQYEPFFSASGAYEDEPALVMQGVTAILRYDPLGRLVRTDFPDGSHSRVDFNPWEQIESDANDTVADSAWYAARQALAGNTSAEVADKRAASLALKDDGTPLRKFLDSVGRVVLTRADLGGKVLDTRLVLDALGNAREIHDPRDLMVTQTFDLLGRIISSTSPDASTSHAIFDALGAPVRQWNARGDEMRTERDALNRVTTLRVIAKGTIEPVLVERTVYGESMDQATAKNANALGKLVDQYDSAGRATVVRYDLDGNATRTERRIAKDPQTPLTWKVLEGALTVDACRAGAEPLLDQEIFETEATFDAAARPLVVTSHDASTTTNHYDIAGRVDGVNVGTNAIVRSITYDSKGRREEISFGNGAATTFRYDAKTFRLAQATTAANGVTIRDIFFAYDPVGNIVEARDEASQLPVDSATAQYTYDSVYRLATAGGIEHPARAIVPAPDVDPIAPIPHPNDVERLRKWIETYTYDDSSNLSSIQHEILGQPLLPKWTRDLSPDGSSNRLKGFAYDDDGNVSSLPKVGALVWDHVNRLVEVDLEGGGKALYAYDCNGARVRKTVVRAAGFVEDRIYVGGFETFRRRVGGQLDFQRDTLHVHDGAERSALLETLAGQTRTRYQIGDHLGSSIVELDETGATISVELYYPYGGTALLATTGVAQTSARRYRYNGKERDEETGLYYYGARYYAPWLARWTTCDPKGADGPNRYRFCRGNPIALRDKTGHESSPFDDSSVAVVMQMHRESIAAEKEEEFEKLRSISSSASSGSDNAALKLGQEFHNRVEQAAKAARLDPGLLAAAIFAEQQKNLKRGFTATHSQRVNTGWAGLDSLGTATGRDEEELRAMKRLVPSLDISTTNLRPADTFTEESAAGKKDSSGTPLAPPERQAFSIPGDQVVLYFAAYLKRKEEILIATIKKEHLKIDFEHLPVEQRFFLTRLAMNPGAVLLKALRSVEKGEDPLRKNVASSKRDPSDAILGATITTAQALHLSWFMFSIDPWGKAYPSRP